MTKPRLTGDELESLALRVGAVLKGHRIEDCITVLAVALSFGLLEGYPPEQREKAWGTVREAIELRAHLSKT